MIYKGFLSHWPELYLIISIVYVNRSCLFLCIGNSWMIYAALSIADSSPSLLVCRFKFRDLATKSKMRLPEVFLCRLKGSRRSRISLGSLNLPLQIVECFCIRSFIYEFIVRAHNNIWLLDCLWKLFSLGNLCLVNDASFVRGFLWSFIFPIPLI